MRCRYCRHPETRVTHTSPHRHPAIVYRRRRCHECGETFATWERYDPRDSTAPKPGNNHRQVNESSRKRAHHITQPAPPLRKPRTADLPPEDD